MAFPGSGGSVEFQDGFSVAPHFMKVLNHVSTHLGLFDIPEKFVQRHGHDLGETVVLKVPSGDSWTLPLERVGEKIWFGSPWKNFVRRYSLVPGRRLFFQYEGNSTFDVVIFDQAESEIGYPVQRETRNGGLAMPKIEETSDDSPVEIIGDFTPGSARNHVQQFSTEADDSPVEIIGDCTVTHSRCKLRHRICSPVSPFRASANQDSAGPSRHRAGRVREVPRRGSLRAALTTIDFQSAYPFFQATISKGYKHRLAVPPIFMVTHNLTQRVEVTLEHSGESWPATLCYYPVKPQGFLSSGWKKFRDDTNIEDGDICMFELIGRDPTVFNVTIIGGNT